MAIKKPKSPMRLTIKAFLPASAADFSEIEADQQYEASPTPPADEHTRALAASTSTRHEERRDSGRKSSARSPRRLHVATE